MMRVDSNFFLFNIKNYQLLGPLITAISPSNPYFLFWTLFAFTTLISPSNSYFPLQPLFYFPLVFTDSTF